MLSIGWPEIMVVAAAALIIVGPRDLPALLRTIGQMTGKLRRMSNEFRSELNKVAALDDVKNIKKSITAPLAKSRAEIEGEFNKITSKGVTPSGKLKPTDPEVESVYDAIKSQTGEIKSPDHAASNASMSAAIAKSTAKVDVAEVAKPKAAAKTTKKSATSKKPVTTKAPAASAAKTPVRKAKPAVVKTPAAKAVTAKPAVTKPVATKPVATKPAAAKTTASKTTPKKPAAKTPRASKPKQPAGKA